MTDDTRTRILDAALTVLSRHGLARLSLEDVARAAKVSRQTVYRYAGSREGLITATIVREEQAFLERMRRATEAHVELQPAFAAAIAEGLRAAREHPLLDRLLETEPEALLPFLIDGTGPVLSAAKTVVSELFTEWLPHLSAAELDRAAEATTRLIISYAISPSNEAVEVQADALAALLIDGLAPRPRDRSDLDVRG